MDKNQNNERRSTGESHDLRVTDLPDVLIKACFSFVGPGHYRFVAGACHRFEMLYSFPKETRWWNTAPSVSCAEFVLQDNALRTEPMEREKVFVGMLLPGASRNGNVQVLQWALDEHGARPTPKELSYAASTTVLEWAERNGIEWNAPVDRDGGEGQSGSSHAWNKHSVLDKSAYHGRIGILDWAFQHRRYERKSFQGASVLAYMNGQVPVLQWLQDHDVLTPMDQVTAAIVAMKGHVAVFQWAKDQDLLDGSIDWLVWRSAADEGNLQVLHWLFENGFGELIGTLNEANIRDTAVLDWANDHGVEWTEGACLSAAIYGHLEVLKRLRVHGCPWDSRTIAGAIDADEPVIAQWARDNGCPEP